MAHECNLCGRLQECVQVGECVLVRRSPRPRPRRVSSGRVGEVNNTMAMDKKEEKALEDVLGIFRKDITGVADRVVGLEEHQADLLHLGMADRLAILETFKTRSDLDVGHLERQVGELEADRHHADKEIKVLLEQVAALEAARKQDREAFGVLVDELHRHNLVGRLLALESTASRVDSEAAELRDDLDRHERAHTADTWPPTFDQEEGST